MIDMYIVQFNILKRLHKKEDNGRARRTHTADVVPSGGEM